MNMPITCLQKHQKNHWNIFLKMENEKLYIHLPGFGHKP